jgi:hypothetical protein
MGQLWCRGRGFASVPEGWPGTYVPGRPLPDDLVDEGKLLLFMADEVVSRAPRTGSRVAQERRKRRETEQAGGVVGGIAKRKKLRGQSQGTDEIPGWSADCIVVNTLPGDAGADAGADVIPDPDRLQG